MILTPFLDRVDAAPLQTGVRGAALDIHFEQQHPAAGGLDVQAGRLGDDGRVGLVALDHAAERPVAAALLVHHALDHHVALRREPGLAQEARRQDHRRHARLHVADAEAVHVAVSDLAAPGIVRPLGAVARGHGVHVAVEDQRAAVPRALERRHQVGPVAVAVPGAGIGEDLHLLVVRLEQPGFQPPAAQHTLQPLLDGELLAVEPVVDGRAVEATMRWRNSMAKPLRASIDFKYLGMIRHSAAP